MDYLSLFSKRLHKLIEDRTVHTDKAFYYLKANNLSSDEFTISLSINHDVYDPVDVVDEYFERLGVEKVDLSDRIIDLNKRNCANFESLSKISPKEVFAPGNNSTDIESLSKIPPGERGTFEKNHRNLESSSRISPIEEDASEKNCANLDSPRKISSEEAITVKKEQMLCHYCKRKSHSETACWVQHPHLRQSKQMQKRTFPPNKKNSGKYQSKRYVSRNTT
ncbi:hypothetical protein CJJ07_004309 [Candidozyma auris]|nr:hypothetical protein CJJ07_004309 [[Candida] auris]